jgi:GntR family transcriptional regulator
LIDKNSPLPMYYQLEEQIKQMIDSGQLKPSNILPSERELSDTYKISRMTVRQAIINLVNKGYLYRLKGKGTFVSEMKLEQDLRRLTSFTEDMTLRGLNPGSKLLKFTIIEPSSEIKSKLHLDVNERVFQIQRIRLANDQPIALETTYIPEKLVPNLTEEILNTSIYKYIEKTLQFSIGHATQIIESSKANDLEILHLHLKKEDPVLLIERQTFLENGTPLEIVNSTYRSDKYKFKINIKRLN